MEAKTQATILLEKVYDRICRLCKDVHKISQKESVELERAQNDSRRYINSSR
jgi:hypothetical protein